MFRLGRQKLPRKEGKRVFPLVFLDPSSPRLSFGSPGPPNDFKVKKPARLGELMTLGLSLISPGRAAIAPSDLFPINRHAKRNKKKKEEQMKPRRYRIMIVIIPYVILLLRVLCATIS